MADVYGVGLATVAIDNEILKATPVPDDGQVIIFQCPASPACRIEVVGVDIAFAVAPVDATNVITGDLVFYDASGNAATVIADDLDFEGVDTAYEGRHLWTGVQSMDEGDTITLKLTVTTPDTAALGGLVTVAYRIKEWSGQ